jgi:PadR family transcriptional regulator PadR
MLDFANRHSKHAYVVHPDDFECFNVGVVARRTNVGEAPKLSRIGLDKTPPTVIPLVGYPSRLSMASNNSAQTALDLLVLTVLHRRGPLHGYGIANSIEELSEEALRIDEGSLYPALHRMEEAGWITAAWKITENKRRARIYELTRDGKKQLTFETERWSNFSSGVARVLRHA